MTTATADLRETIKLLPGYDPYRDAEGYEFRPEIAQRVIDFFHECIVHIKGEWAGQPMCLEPWQQAIIANLFGWVQDRRNRRPGTRRYREALIYIPRKNGKTSIVAGIPLWMLFCDDEPGPEIYAAASDKDQASLLFDLSKNMILREPELEKRCKIYRALKSIQCTDNPGSIYRCLSADADTKHGFNSHCVVIDELHAQPDRKLVDVLETSTGSRRQPLIVHLTTADFHRESICNEKHEYASKVRDGKIEDPTFLPAIYEASLEEDWQDPEVWKRANPNYGISFYEDYIEGKCRKAKSLPSFENTFKRLHLNIKTEQADRWIPMEQWERCGELDFSDRELHGQACWGGLDLSSTKDISAFLLVFRHDGGYKVLPYFWVPAENAYEREKLDRVQFSTWERQGFLKLTEGNAIDYNEIRRDINDLGERFRIEAIGADKWNALEIMQHLGDEDGFEVHEFRQGMGAISAASKEFERLVALGKLHHRNNPVLWWMASNVTKYEDHMGNIRPDKKKSTERIDGIVALIMAIGEAVAAGEVHDGPSLFSLESDS